MPLTMTARGRCPVCQDPVELTYELYAMNDTLNSYRFCLKGYYPIHEPCRERLKERYRRMYAPHTQSLND
jgi:hypothetical protein